ncbi:MAG: imidazoleglycerol-phosphate dehydratase [Nitrososphaerales archaeon]
MAMIRLRKSKVERITKETVVKVELKIDGKGKNSVETTIPFLDHLISTIAKHSMMDLKLIAKSKDKIVHHIAEDVALTLANAMDKALGNREKIFRFGYAIVPMDDALAFAAVDLVKRQYYTLDLKLSRMNIEGMSKEDLEHFFRSLAQNMNACTHIVVQYGSNDHHKVEAATKALAVALRIASSVDRKGRGVPSTKGAM